MEETATAVTSQKPQIPQKETAENTQRSLVLECAMQAGNILLQNGAEIFRVEETITRMCDHFGVESESAFILSNGIFITAGNEKESVTPRCAIFLCGERSWTGWRRSTSFPEKLWKGIIR
ncbi:MAG: threonine/serine exporter family protein [Eisenbergiella massiliensis]